MGVKSSRGALGGAVKQLGFDSTAPAKTNMADKEGGGGGIRQNITIRGGFQTWNINITKDPCHTSPLPGGEAPCHDVNVKKKKVLLALIAWKHSAKFSILQHAVITLEVIFIQLNTVRLCCLIVGCIRSG